MITTKDIYLRWLRAAYLYYIDPNGNDTGMHDFEWDHISREMFATKDHLPKDEFPIIHHELFTGGSLYWLRKEDYPIEATKR